MAEPLATRLQNKCAENVIDNILDQYATCRSSVVLRFRHTQGIYKELGEELRNLDWPLDVKSQLEMSKNLMVSDPFPFVVFPFPCLLLAVAE